MITSIILIILIGGYSVFLVIKDIKASRQAKKTGIPKGCSCCPSKKCNKTGQSNCSCC